jgi:YD repeat-containing protein
MLSQTDAQGQTLLFSYDDLGRVTEKRSGSVTLASFRYDEPGHGAGVGRRTSMTDASGSSAWTYDALGREVSKTQVIEGEVFNTAQSYDVAGRLSTQTYPDGEVVSYGYDAAGRIASAGNYVLDTLYDARGSVLTRALGNGVVENFSYDTDRLWLKSVSAKRLGETVHDLSWTRDSKGQVLTLTSAVDPDDNASYTYDDLGRLTAASIVEVAVCTPASCGALGKNYGAITDGCGAALDCGSCTLPETCGGGGVANVCGQPACTPASCAALGKNCGAITDGCSATLDCGRAPCPRRAAGVAWPTCAVAAAPARASRSPSTACSEITSDRATWRSARTERSTERSR